MPSDVPRCVGRLLPKSEWGDGKPVESNTTATDSEPESEAGDESNSAEESTETKTTLVTVNHGFVVDSINVNGTRFGSSQGGNEAIIELEADEEILYVAAKRVRNVFKAVLSDLYEAYEFSHILGTRYSYCVEIIENFFLFKLQ